MTHSPRSSKGEKRETWKDNEKTIAVRPRHVRYYEKTNKQTSLGLLKYFTTPIPHKLGSITMIWITENQHRQKLGCCVKNKTEWKHVQILFYILYIYYTIFNWIQSKDKIFNVKLMNCVFCEYTLLLNLMPATDCRKVGPGAGIYLQISLLDEGS